MSSVLIPSSQLEQPARNFWCFLTDSQSFHEHLCALLLLASLAAAETPLCVAIKWRNSPLLRNTFFTRKTFGVTAGIKQVIGGLWYTRCVWGVNEWSAIAGDHPVAFLLSGSEIHTLTESVCFVCCECTRRLQPAGRKWACTLGEFPQLKNEPKFVKHVQRLPR